MASKFRPRLTDDDKHEVVRMARDLVPYREIGEAFGISPSMVTYYVTRAGGIDRPQPEPEQVTDDPELLFVDMPWSSDALCAQTDPDAFYPEKGGSAKEAKRVCMACPVRLDCLQHAVEHGERYGVWGGLSERERRRIDLSTFDTHTHIDSYTDHKEAS